MRRVVTSVIPFDFVNMFNANKFYGRLPYAALVAVFILSIPSMSAFAQTVEADTAPPESAPHNIYFGTSIATRHFRPNPEHNNTQHLLNLEWNYRDNTVVGGAYFKNSYRQPTTLVYWGKKYHPFDASPNTYVKVVGGLIHGYKDEYQNNIPLNKYGTAPVVLPAVGYCYKQLCTEVIVFGTAGAIWTGGVRF